MVRGFSIMLGFGLIALCIVGVASPGGGTWLAWLDGAAGVMALFAGAPAGSRANPAARATGPILLSLGLFALWAVGWVTGMRSWMAWWTFAFACAFGLLGLLGGAMRKGAVAPVSEIRSKEEERRNRFRRSA